MKILIIKKAAIGDILMTTPLIRQLKQSSQKDVQIDYCVSQSCAIVLKHNPNINNIITIPDAYFTAFKLYKLIFIFFNKLRKNNYDYVFILDKKWIYSVICRFSFFSPKLVGFVRNNFVKYFLDIYVEYKDITKYHVNYYLDLLSKSKITNVDYTDIDLDLTVLESDKKIVHDKLFDFKIKDFIIVCNSGGNNNFETSGIRMLPQDKIIELLSILLQKNTVILLGGKQDYDNYDKYCNLLIDYPQLFNFANVFTLAQSAYLMSYAKHIFVTDCGVMHLGFAMRLAKKMTCFFGPSNPLHVVSKNNQSSVVWQDEDIYDKNYSLRGKINNKIEYFRKLEFNEIKQLY